jgi:hypothetical protein
MSSGPRKEAVEDRLFREVGIKWEVDSSSWTSMKKKWSTFLIHQLQLLSINTGLAAHM